MFEFGNLKKIDSSLLVTIVLLCIIGAINVFSTTYFPEKEASKFFFNQLLFYGVGFILFFVFSTFDYSKLKNRYVAFGVFFTTIGLLIAVLLIGDYAFEAKRWIVVGPFTIQPSEFSKVSIILITAFCFTKGNIKRFERIKNIYKIKGKKFGEKLGLIIADKQFVKVAFSVLALISIVLLIILQKSLGNSVITVLIFLSLVYFSVDISFKTLIYLIIAGIVFNLSFHFVGFSNLQESLNLNQVPFDIFLWILSVVIIIFLIRKFTLKPLATILIVVIILPSSLVLGFIYNNALQPYQRSRIENFVTPDSNEALGDNYNKEQAILAVGSGGIVGRGFLNGNVTNLGLLPFAFTDFAFASFAEQFGFLGNVFLFCLYFFLIFKILSIARSTRSQFGMLICSGISVMICLNTFQHIGMNMGILPITGVPLPFISYGGSAVLTIFLGMGLVSSIQIKSETEEEDVINIKNEMIRD
ncbi:MAG: FtsW/RodA/SpoVE family cell cycle protein [Candidatus Dojkabacteria bacterium]